MIAMIYTTEHIASILKSARKARGLSQRALSAKVGVPQSHLSKVEKGAVDLRVSSLVELARALDLELMLVPRKSAPAVNALVHALPISRETETSRPAYALDEEDDG